MIESDIRQDANHPIKFRDFQMSTSALTAQLRKASIAQSQEDEEVVIEIKDYQEPKSAKVGLRDFELLSVLGRGAYGSIVLHTHSHEQTRNERSILQELEFQFIVKLHYAFQTDTKLYLLLTYAPGALQIIKN